jgi:hypothetical protein
MRLRRLAPLALGAIPLALFFWEAWGTPRPIDDAYISYRYARHLVEGDGLVFNVGERVEGYTNLLWTLLIAGGVALGVSAPLVTHVLSLASGALLLVSSQLYAALLLPAGRLWLAAFAPLAVLAANSFVAWTPSGLETLLFAALVTLVLAAQAASRIGWACAFCILATLTRPEGALVAALVLGSDWIRKLVVERPLRLRRLLVVSTPCLAFAAYLAAHTLFRWLYYGDFVPNTFHAKVGGIPFGRGFAYVRAFFVDGAALLVPAALVGAWLAREAWLAVAVVVATTLYTVAVGGDAFPLGRFLLPALPALVAAAIAGSERLFRRSRIAGVGLGLTLPAFALWSLYGFWPSPEFQGVSREFALVSAKRTSAREARGPAPPGQILRRARQIHRLEPPVRTLAAVAIGEIGYRLPDVTIVDLVGLTDRHIAKSEKRIEGALVLPGHHRTDAEYILDREPDVLWIPRAGRGTFPLPCILELWANPRLEREYFWDDHLEVYRRRHTPLSEDAPLRSR